MASRDIKGKKRIELRMAFLSSEVELIVYRREPVRNYWKSTIGFGRENRNWNLK